MLVNRYFFDSAVSLVWRKANLRDLALVQADDRRQRYAAAIQHLCYLDGTDLNHNKTENLRFSRLLTLQTFKSRSHGQLLSYLNQPQVKRLELIHDSWSDDDFSAAAKSARKLEHIRLENKTSYVSSSAIATFFEGCKAAECIELVLPYHEGASEYLVRVAKLQKLQKLSHGLYCLTADDVEPIEDVSEPFPSLQELRATVEAAALPTLCCILPADSLSGLVLRTTGRMDKLFEKMARLTRLQRLELFLTYGMFDMKPLSGMYDMRTLRLDCYWGGFDDLEFLSGMARLQDLSLTFQTQPIMDPLSGLVNLRKLRLDTKACCQSLDTRFFAKMHSLQDLELIFTENFKTTPLSGLVNLRRLQLADRWFNWNRSDNKQALDVSFLASLSNLQELKIDCRRDLDIAPLSGMHSLRKLSLHYSTPGPLHERLPSDLPGLQELHIDAVQMPKPPADAPPVSLPANLLKLDLVVDCTPGGDPSLCLKPLSGLASLRVLKLRLNGKQLNEPGDVLHRVIAVDTEPLSGLVRLRTLDLSCGWYMNIFSLELWPLSRLTNLRALRILFNESAWLDIRPLSRLTKLRKLHLKCALFWWALHYLSPLRRLEKINLESETFLADLANEGVEGSDAMARLFAPFSRLRKLRMRTYMLNDREEMLHLPVRFLSRLGRHCPSIAECEVVHIFVELQDLEACEALTRQHGFCKKLCIGGFVDPLSRPPGNDLASTVSDFIDMFRRKFPSVKRLHTSTGFSPELQSGVVSGLRITPRDDPSRDDDASGAVEADVEECDGEKWDTEEYDTDSTAHDTDD